ncbi:hypothetical protein [Bacillus sp. KH172YL63]|uniref:hypothetical protein n=1 Tax=Bacillus sp. KH172YL63 TaxID=2709784 RepID=UPI0013E41935|nr:hypothetical protein [Bacillus sp. KH172YL63]BCB04189.1 hypothetical protein KH172YL63_23220 [Bacillus sp. KH172YL63]
MLWWIIGIGIVAGTVSALFRRKSFDASNKHERQIQEEERVKAGSWWGGGGQ